MNTHPKRPRPALPAAIDYAYFRDIAIRERRAAIAAFPGRIGRMTRRLWRRLFSTLA